MDQGAVLIVDRGTGDQVAVCEGPLGDGLCTQAESGQVVACAGREIGVGRGATDHRHVVVPGDLEVCPLMWVLRSR